MKRPESFYCSFAPVAVAGQTFLPRRLRLCFCLRILSDRLCSGVFIPCSISSSSHIFLRAKNLFRARDLSCCILMIFPEGMCLSWTQDEVLLTFWPPGPEPFIKDSSRSPSFSWQFFIRSCSSAVFFSLTPKFILLLISLLYLIWQQVQLFLPGIFAINICQPDNG